MELCFCSHTDFLPFLLIIFIFCSHFGTALQTITASQFIQDPETVSSSDNLFKLGFFSPENSTNRYVGIWYLSESTVIWVANRNQPLRDSSGVITISEDGNLVVLNGQKQVLWSSNVSNTSSSSIAQLTDSGNLVLRDNTTGNLLWQSFQHPSDTQVPIMKIGTNKRTGEKVQITSWKSASDPSIGNFSLSLGGLNIPEVFIRNGDLLYWRSGPWNGSIFIGVPGMNSLYMDGYNMGNEEDGTAYLTFLTAKGTDFVTIVLNSHGRLEQTRYVDKKIDHKCTVQNSDCDVYGKCGAFGSCNAHDYPICSCLKGFVPRSEDEWGKQKWTSGCVRREPLACERVKNESHPSQGDGFLKLQMMKVPDFAEWSSASEASCRNQCLQNCSCTAYAYDAGIGCMYWTRSLIDIQRFSSGGVDLYIRLYASELDGEKKQTVKIVIIATIGTISTVAVCAYVLWTWTAKDRDADNELGSWFWDCSESLRNKRRKALYMITKGKIYPKIQSGKMIGDLKEVKLQELPLFSFGKLATATNNFHLSNKLGEGGFGSVYKGILQDGQEIAVKRLSAKSEQGQEEFMNEMVLISRLQHRNLVKLLGCCVEGDEKMLIYECMPNKSLDAFLFEPIKRKFLNWKKRFNIIEGIARGLLYLHRDSRLLIIHRDLKASNILLDGELNPKISDFGMAKIFGGSGSHQVKTRRVVGTYGYMSPEYAMTGLFSEKTDVFSYGVLLLEIVSGRRNNNFYDNEQCLTLLGCAWKLWKEDNISSLVDLEILDDEGSGKDILRCIHIGLLCVQELARNRPTMATVVSMLNSEIVNLPSPGQPAFVQREVMLNSQSSMENQSSHSTNNVTVTNIIGR